MIGIVVTILLVVIAIAVLSAIAKRLVAKNPQKRLMILATVLLIAIVLVIGIPSLVLLRSFKVLSLYSTMQKSLVDTVGLNTNLAKGILLLAFAPYVLVIRWFFSLSRKKRRAARMLLVVYTASYYLAMYFLTQNVYFAHGSGEAIKWCAVTPEGWRFFDSPGYDPKYGIELKKVTPEVAREYEMTKGVAISSVPAQVDTMNQFFDRYTGAPKVWYAERPDGGLDFFANPGFHPKYGTQLKPATADIVRQAESQIVRAQQEKARLDEEERRLREIEDRGARARQIEADRRARIERYLNTSASQLAGRKSTLVMAVDRGPGGWSTPSSTLESDLKNLLAAKSLNVVTGLFRSGFYSEGHADDLFSGRTGIVQELGVSCYVDYLLLVAQETQFFQDERAGGLISARMTLDYKVLAGGGQEIKAGTLVKSGIGPSEHEAQMKALAATAETLAGVLLSL